MRVFAESLQSLPQRQKFVVQTVRQEAVMDKSKILTVLLAGLLSVPVYAQNNRRAEALLEAARQKETLEGDIKGAIRQYEEIVRRYSSDRVAAAKALVRMAEGHQKLGDAE